MRSLVRPKLILMLIAVVMGAPATVSLAIAPIHANVAHARALLFPATGELDCNGYSKIQRPLKRNFPCADITGHNGERGEDNGHYIGHDEPSAQFISNVPGSGNNVRWEIRLPQEHALPATQTFENLATFWFSMALCEPTSYPLNPCIPNSDQNSPSRFSNDPTAGGSAFLELQFYPPGFYPYLTQLSCDATHWCAAMTIDSLKCDPAAPICNPNCTEPANFAFIQKDGIPAGPPGPASATNATFTPNAQTLLMNQGDQIEITMHDTAQGVINRVDDKTTGQSGFMVGSAENGFQSLDVNTCAPTNFDFHPEFNTAQLRNVDSWTFLEANIGIAFELGHFEVGTNGDGDADDGACFPGPTVPGCSGADLDYDGTSYQPDWPDGTPNTPTSIQIYAPRSAWEDNQYTSQYPSLMFETEVLSTESTCNSDGSGCTMPPPGATFYPFFAQSRQGAKCNLTFGNDIRGTTINDFGRDAEYGEPDFTWFWGTTSSGILPNPCTRSV
jgi:hypothetical protein